MREETRIIALGYHLKELFTLLDTYLKDFDKQQTDIFHTKYIKGNEIVELEVKRKTTCLTNFLVKLTYNADVTKWDSNIFKSMRLIEPDKQHRFYTRCTICQLKTSNGTRVLLHNLMIARSYNQMELQK